MRVRVVWLRKNKNLFSVAAWDTSTVCEAEHTENILTHVFGFAFFGGGTLTVQPKLVLILESWVSLLDDS